MRHLFLFLILFLPLAHAERTIDAVIFEYQGVFAKVDKTDVIDWVKDSYSLSKEEVGKVVKAYEEEESKWGFINRLTKIFGNEVPAEWKEFYREQKIRSLKPIPGMFELVLLLQQRGIVTAMFTDASEEEVHLIAEKGHYRLFDPCLFCYELGVSKTKKKAYKELKEALGLPPERCLFIDCKSIHVDAAKKRGFDAIEFKGIKELKQALEERGVIESELGRKG